MRAVKSILCAGLLVGSAAPALAQGPAVTPRRAAPVAAPARLAARPQHMRFGDDLVEGNRATGGGSLVSGNRPAKQSRLLITRTTFLPELIKSAESF